MSPWDVLLASDAAVRLASASVLVGWTAGALCVLCFGWRRLSRPRDEDVSALRRECRDLRDTVARMRREREDQDRVLGGLYEQHTRLARRLVEMVGQGAARKDVA